MTVRTEAFFLINKRPKWIAITFCTHANTAQYQMLLNNNAFDKICLYLHCSTKKLNKMCSLVTEKLKTLLLASPTASCRECM